MGSSSCERVVQLLCETRCGRRRWFIKTWQIFLLRIWPTVLSKAARHNHPLKSPMWWVWKKNAFNRLQKMGSKIEDVEMEMHKTYSFWIDACFHHDGDREASHWWSQSQIWQCPSKLWVLGHTLASNSSINTGPNQIYWRNNTAHDLQILNDKLHEDVGALDFSPYTMKWNTEMLLPCTA